MGTMIRARAVAVLVVCAAYAGCRHEPLVQVGCDPDEYVAVTPTSATLGVGERARFTGQAILCGRGSRALAWSVRDTMVAVIEQADSVQATVLGRAPGQTIVIATTPSHSPPRSAAASITVPAPQTSPFNE